MAALNSLNWPSIQYDIRFVVQVTWKQPTSVELYAKGSTLQNPYISADVMTGCISHKTVE